MGLQIAHRVDQPRDIKLLKVRNKRGGYIYINPEDDEECILEDEYISRLHNKIWEDEI